MCVSSTNNVNLFLFLSYLYLGFFFVINECCTNVSCFSIWNGILCKTCAAMVRCKINKITFVFFLLLQSFLTQNVIMAKKKNCTVDWMLHKFNYIMWNVSYSDSMWHEFHFSLNRTNETRTEKNQLKTIQQALDDCFLVRSANCWVSLPTEMQFPTESGNRFDSVLSFHFWR